MIDRLRRLWSRLPLAFRIGLVLGAVVSAYPLITGIVIIGPQFVAKYRAVISVDGAAAKRHGAEKIVITDDGIKLTQTCGDDGCDDITVKLRDASEFQAPDVTVLSADGRELMSGEIYVDSLAVTHVTYDEAAFRGAEADRASMPSH